MGLLGMHVVTYISLDFVIGSVSLYTRSCH